MTFWENALWPSFLDSETAARSELEQARRLAESLGLNFRVAEFSILMDEEFAENSQDRCYICKKKSAAVLKSIAREDGIDCIADGVNLSDYQDFRPGIQACNEEGIWHPFVESGISKEDIRTLARGLGLACLGQAFLCLPVLKNSLRREDHRK